MQKDCHSHTCEHTERHYKRLKFIPLEFLAESLKNNNNDNRCNKNRNRHNTCAHSNRLKLSVLFNCRSCACECITDECRNKTDKCCGGNNIAEFVFTACVVSYLADLALNFLRKTGISISERITPIVITHETAANIFGSAMF